MTTVSGPMECSRSITCEQEGRALAGGGQGVGGRRAGRRPGNARGSEPYPPTLGLSPEQGVPQGALAWAGLSRLNTGSWPHSGHSPGTRVQVQSGWSWCGRQREDKARPAAAGCLSMEREGPVCRPPWMAPSPPRHPPGCGSSCHSVTCKTDRKGWPETPPLAPCPTGNWHAVDATNTCSVGLPRESRGTRVVLWADPVSPHIPLWRGSPGVPTPLQVETPELPSKPLPVYSTGSGQRGLAVDKTDAPQAPPQFGGLDMRHLLPRAGPGLCHQGKCG